MKTWIRKLVIVTNANQGVPLGTTGHVVCEELQNGHHILMVERESGERFPINAYYVTAPVDDILES